MSVKNGYQRTAKRVWIPLISLFALMPGLHADGAVRPPEGPGLEFRTGGAGLIARDTGWDLLLQWILQRLIDRLDCGLQNLPPEVPLAMEMTIDCYATGGLVVMSPAEIGDFLGLLNEAEDAMKDSPPGFSANLKSKFLVALSLMRAEAEAQQ